MYTAERALVYLDVTGVSTVQNALQYMLFITLSLYLRRCMSLSGLVRNSRFSVSVYGFGSSAIVGKIHIGERTKVVIWLACGWMAGSIWTADDLQSQFSGLYRIYGAGEICIPASYERYFLPFELHTLIVRRTVQHASLEL